MTLTSRAVEAGGGVEQVQGRAERLAAIEAGFGAWTDKAHDGDGVTYVERIRPGMVKSLADANG